MDRAPNKETQVQDLIKSLRAHRSEDSNKGVLELARLVLKARSPWTSGPAWWTSLRDALAADGWEYDEAQHRLVPTVPATRVLDEVTWIEDNLTRRGWATASEHYRQAIDNFSSGNWASANGQLRTFFEDLIRTAAGPKPNNEPRKVHPSADKLNQDGLLISDEREFIKALWKMLHPQGAHPGISDEDESRFRLLTLTGYARFLLSRLPLNTDT